MLVLILSGGTGTRLWPRSRTSLPKQLQPLVEERTMVQATVDRVTPIIPPKHIFFGTNAHHGAMIAEQLPEIPAENIVKEPSGKNTAPAIGLAALHLEQIDPDEVMASLHADHFIADEEGFRQALLAAEKVARDGYLVTLGIEPTKPDTGYGYIEREAEVGQYDGYEAYKVKQFLEKPDLETAEKFYASGKHYWNSGIFIWQISTLLEAFADHIPDLSNRLDEMREALAAGEPIEPIWEKVESVSIDVGIMERAEKVAVIPVDIGWNDVGAWDAIHEVSDTDEDDNVINGQQTVVFDTTGSLIQSKDRLIAVVGVEDLIVVDSGDAVLICARDKAQDVKKIVNWLEEQGRDELL